MRSLILSDIHANWEALEAVLRQAKDTYDEVICCGDLVGYGPDPNRVTEWVRSECKAVIRGNHDKVATGLDDSEWFNPVAKAAAQWTIEVLTGGNADYLRELPKGPLELESFQIAHGSPLDEDAYLISLEDAGDAFEYIERPLTFIGHTHIQGGFGFCSRKVWPLQCPPIHLGLEGFDLRPDDLYLVNPGAVGQPRDGDPRAAFALFDSEERCVYFGRAEYPIERVQRKIIDAGLPDLLAHRLAFGR